MKKKKENVSGQRRQQKYMDTIRNDPVKYEKYLQDERERWQRRKASRQPSNDREARMQKKKWREYKQKSRAKARSSQHLTPDTTTNNLSPVDKAGTSLSFDVSGNNILTSTPSYQKIQGRKKVRRDRSKMFQENCSLKVKLFKETQRSDKYRKRAERLAQKKEKSNTPRSKTTAMLGKVKVPREVRRALLFGNVISRSLRDKYLNTKSDREKSAMARMMSANLLKKYKLTTFCEQVTGISRKRLYNIAKDPHKYRRQYNTITQRTKGDVLAFYIRDDNSRNTAGKSDVVSRKGQKEQKRLLLDTLVALHAKYCNENPSMKISYMTFCSLKPFWVTRPSIRDRQTCLCKPHENGRLVLQKLVVLKVLPPSCSSVSFCVKNLVCENPTINCYMRKCHQCRDKTHRQVTGAFDGDTTTSWHQWNLVSEKRMIRGAETVVKRTIKQEVSGTVGELVGSYIGMCDNLCRHVFTISHQFEHYKRIKELLSEDCVVMVVDFSENFECKYDRAVQSSHFGCSNNQVCLHTGVAYFKHEVMSFCTVSASTRHEPAAIWAHLQPVLHEVQRTHPEVKTIHFWSDGPTTQYRNKHHVLLSSYCAREAGFDTVTWNYFEAGHGKSAADSVGGTLKRTAESAIGHGALITTAEEFYTVLSDKTNIKLFLVPEENIDEVFRKIPPGVKAIGATMKMHQFHVIRTGKIVARDFSCFCQFPAMCMCYNSREVTFPPLVAAVSDIQGSVATPSEPAVAIPLGNVAVIQEPILEMANTARSQAITIQDAALITLPTVGDWCVVSYEGKCYIGQVVDRDEEMEEVQVSTLECTGGSNKFKFPRISDKIWYRKEQVVKAAKEPTTVSRRCFCVSDEDYAYVCE